MDTLSERALIMLNSNEKNLLYILQATLGKECRFVKNCHKDKPECMHCKHEYIGWKDGENGGHFCGIFNGIINYNPKYEEIKQLIWGGV